MTEHARWKPATSDQVFDARRDRTRNGRVRLRNGSNLLFGSVFAWGLFAMAALMLNRSSLNGSDAMTPREVALTAMALAIASLAAHAVLVRPFVEIEIDGGIARVRNPLKAYSFWLGDAESFDLGFLGFPVVSVGSYRVRLMGMEESVAQKMGGGSIDHAIFVQELSRQAGDNAPDNKHPVSVHWALFDLWTTILIVAWAVYALSFVAPA